MHHLVKVLTSTVYTIKQLSAIKSHSNRPYEQTRCKIPPEGSPFLSIPAYTVSFCKQKKI